MKDGTLIRIADMHFHSVDWIYGTVTARADSIWDWTFRAERVGELPWVIPCRFIADGGMVAPGVGETKDSWENPMVSLSLFKYEIVKKLGVNK